MKQSGGIWLPDHERHLQQFLENKQTWVDGKGTYQFHKLAAAMKWCRQFRFAVDVGAHVGLWTMQLVKRFEWVYAFEPVAAHRECFVENLRGNANHSLIPYAVGHLAGAVDMHTTDGSSGDSWVSNEKRGQVSMVTLDEYGWENVDFIKLDNEGFELFGLRGAERMLKRCHPCVIVEQKPGRAQKFGLGETDAVTYLRDLGAHLRAVLAGDYIMSWDPE